MGKRFVASELWDKDWFRMLTPKQKVFWYYLIQKCDCAGVWEPNFALATFCIGETITEKDLAAFGDRVEKLPNGKWWLNSFISFQNGELRESCGAHIPIIKSVLKNKLATIKITYK